MSDNPTKRTLVTIPLDLGPLPIARVNAVLNTALVSGDVRFSVRAQRHSLLRHPDDFELCRRNVGPIIANPDYIGKAPHQVDGFELIGKIRQESAIILVANQDADG